MTQADSSEKQNVMARLFARLEPEKLYAAATLVQLAELENLFPVQERDPKDVRDHRARMRLRIYFNRMIDLHPDLFPKPDGLIEAPGQAPLQGYQGRRFQRAMARLLALQDAGAGSPAEKRDVDPANL